MTIASSVSKTPTYACNGFAVTFPYGFKLLTTADMTVILEDASGIQTTLAYGTDFTLTGVGNDAGGSITTTVAYATGNKLTGIRVPSFLQGVDLQNQGAFFAQVIEDALDLAAMRDQTLDGRISNAIRAPDTETVSMVLPSATLRANKYLIFDANGEPTYINSQIDARYYGSLGADPATRPDGSARQAGDLYFNTVSLGFRTYSGVGWQAAIPPASLTLVNFTETAASAKTVFTISGGYTVGTAFAYLNGVLLAPDEVTISNGTTAVLSAACVIGDEFRLVGFSPFSVADTLSRSSNLNDLPDKPTALTNLGFSSFVQSLKAAADAAAMRLLLGAQAALGFTPVEQGGGTDMGVNKIRIGWRGDGTGLQLQVDASVIGVIPVRTEILGISQTWQNVIGSRAVSTSYQNTTGRPIQVYIDANSTVASGRPIEVSIDNATWVQVHQTNGSAGGFVSSGFIVPNSQYYRVNGAASLKNWVELR